MKHLLRAVPALAAVLLTSATSLASLASAGSGSAWEWPLEPAPDVVRGFEPPSSPYGPGHRGVDLAGSVGQQVLAVAAGTVTFAGSVAGRGVVVVEHGRLSSTYQPVTATVPAGVRVSSRQPIGFLELVGSHCLPRACLHLGAKRGDAYLDPLRLLPARPVRLKPLRGLSGLDRTVGLEPQPPPRLLPPNPGARRPRGSPGPRADATVVGIRLGLLVGRTGQPLRR